MGYSVVVLETDPRIAETLAGKLSSHFHAIHQAHTDVELRERVTKNRPELVILDMETSRLTDVKSLHDDFPLLPIVCTHRIADEELWVAAMEAGATDVCCADEVESAVLRSAAKAKFAAA